MKKSDLKTGMIVKYRDGEIRIVNLEDGTLEKEVGITSNFLKVYRENLLSTGSVENDIVEVYELIWTRPRQMTVQQLVESHKQHTGEDVEVV
jgi:hypothetical protein